MSPALLLLRTCSTCTVRVAVVLIRTLQGAGASLTSCLNLSPVVVTLKRLYDGREKAGLTRSLLIRAVRTLIRYSVVVFCGHMPSQAVAAVLILSADSVPTQVPLVGHKYEAFCAEHPDVTFRISRTEYWLHCQDLPLYMQLRALNEEREAFLLLRLSTEKENQ